MEILDKTLFTNNEEDLKKIYNEQVQKLRENEFKLCILKRLSIEDFPKDLSETSKTNIEKALLAVKIRDHINLENGQKLLGLDDFDTKKINLSYLEKKMIRERVEHLIVLEKKKKSLELKDSDDLTKAQNLLVQLQKENITMTEELAELKLQEFKLLKEVSENIVSPVQKNLVKGILDDARIVQLKTRIFNQVMVETETSTTRHAKKAIAEASGYIDQLLEAKQSTQSRSTQ